MRILILFNPIAGSGKAAETAVHLTEVIRQAGHEPRLAPTRVGRDTSWLDDLMQDADATVIVGGDGAVRMASGSAARTQTPICLWPGGTENLFAREFRFERDEQQLLRTLEQRAIRSIDLGTVNGRPFVLMVSLGIDAAIVHDLDTNRRGAISHLSYVPPILRQAWRWSPPQLSIDVDGACIADSFRGSVVIANSRQYAMRLNPAWKARMDDQFLDVVLLPGGRIGTLSRAVRFRLGQHERDRSLSYHRCRSVKIRCTTPQFYQLDGDAPRGDDRAADRRVDALDIQLSDQVLPVLIPIDAR